MKYFDEQNVKKFNIRNKLIPFKITNTCIVSRCILLNHILSRNQKQEQFSRIVQFTFSHIYVSPGIILDIYTTMF